MSTLDLLIIVAYLVVMLAVGLYYRRFAGKSLENFFLAGRSVPGWKAGFSMAAPDDESGAETDTGARRADVPASANLPAVIVRTHRVDLRGRELLAPVVAFGTRLRGRISYLSGRATA